MVNTPQTAARAPHPWSRLCSSDGLFDSLN